MPTSPAIPIRRIGLANGPDRLFSKIFRERPRTLVKLTRSPRHGRRPAPRSRTSAASSRIAAARRISPLSGGRSFLPAALCSSPPNSSRAPGADPSARAGRGGGAPTGAHEGGSRRVRADLSLSRPLPAPSAGACEAAAATRPHHCVASIRTLPGPLHRRCCSSSEAAAAAAGSWQRRLPQGRRGGEERMKRNCCGGAAAVSAHRRAPGSPHLPPGSRDAALSFSPGHRVAPPSWVAAPPPISPKPCSPPSPGRVGVAQPRRSDALLGAVAWPRRSHI